MSNSIKFGMSFSVTGPNTPERNSSYRVRVVGNTFEKIHAILAKMSDRLSENGQVTIVELRYFAGSDISTDEDHEYEYHWGWTSMKTTRILDTSDGFVLSIAPAQLIDVVS